MKFSIKSQVVFIIAGFCSLIFSANALADYRVTALGHSSEFGALLGKNVSNAKVILSDQPLVNLDFLEANNLCVTHILDKNYTAAELACSAALEKLDSISIMEEVTMGTVTRRKAKSAIYSNLAVAKALNGDVTNAVAALEEALSVNPGDRNAIANYGLVSERLPESRLASVDSQWLATMAHS